jgi:UDP-N-acetylglucosamine transferase subunit ALG13
MIFVTVGTQLPFDRLIRAVDGWAATRPQVRVFAQNGPGNYRPAHIQCQAELNAEAFERAMQEATLIVAHAGMGTILSALERGKPVIVMPRRASLGEHRNEHQLATVAKLSHLSGLHIVADEEALSTLLSDHHRLIAGPALGSAASPRLISAIREFISP